MLADPEQAPGRAARAAVRHLGPPARDWAARTRARYPGASTDGLAHLATRQFVRLARRQGAVTGMAGAFGPLAGAGLVAHTQARLVLHIAAAYGVDPTSEDRVGDIVALLRLPPASEPLLPALTGAGRLLGACLVSRLAARLVPFGAVLTGSLYGGRDTEALAFRAMLHFRRVVRGAPVARQPPRVAEAR